jgi:hypothetical protein
MSEQTQSAAEVISTSPAVDSVAATAAESIERLPYMTDGERDDWKKKGVLPERFNSDSTTDDGEKLTREERDKWQSSGELPDRQQELASAPESTGDGEQATTEERETWHRAWMGQASEEESQTLLTRANDNAGRALQHISKHPQRSNIETGLKGMLSGVPDGFRNDFTMAVAELKNAGEVLSQVALSKQVQDAVLNCPNWMTLRLTLRNLSRSIASKPEVKTKAPRPPAEVGGRSSAPIDEEQAAIQANDYRKLKNVWNRQATRGK